MQKTLTKIWAKLSTILFLANFDQILNWKKNSINNFSSLLREIILYLATTFPQEFGLKYCYNFCKNIVSKLWTKILSLYYWQGPCHNMVNCSLYIQGIRTPICCSGRNFPLLGCYICAPICRVHVTPIYPCVIGLGQFNSWLIRLLYKMLWDSDLRIRTALFLETITPIMITIPWISYTLGV